MLTFFIFKISRLCDLENASICPTVLGIGKPGIQIAGIDNFRNDTLTEAGTSHRTDIMYMQHSGLVTPTGNVNVDSDNISESLNMLHG